VLLLSLIFISGGVTEPQLKKTVEAKVTKQEVAPTIPPKVEPIIIKDEIIAKKYEPPPTIQNLFVVTGYSQSAAEGTADGITADGTRVGYGVCAADVRYHPFGTVFDIPGYGRCVVHDTGGAIRGNRIDAFFPTREEAFRWGRRTLTVTIVR